MRLELKRPLVFLDLETTGLDIEKDRIVQIGMKKIDSQGRPTFYDTLVNPTVPIPEAATEIHGIKDGMVKDKPKFNDIANEVLEFIAGCDLSGYNIFRFDAPFVNAEFVRVGITWDYSQINFVDSLLIARKMEPRDLTWASKFYCNYDHTYAHNARADAIVASNVLLAQIDKYDGIPSTVEELALFCNDGNKLLDLSGKFRYNESGEIVFNFGKHKDEPAMSHADYLSWMLGSDFPADTKRLIRKMLL